MLIKLYDFQDCIDYTKLKNKSNLWRIARKGVLDIRR